MLFGLDGVCEEAPLMCEMIYICNSKKSYTLMWGDPDAGDKYLRSDCRIELSKEGSITPRIPLYLSRHTIVGGVSQTQIPLALCSMLVDAPRLV